MLRLATRRNAVALRRAHTVAALVQAQAPELDVQLLDLNTEADRALEAGSASIVGKGPCAREIQQALLARRADLAVHALKDLPLESDPRLTLVAVPNRGDPRDALCATQGWTVSTLPEGARVGTGSARRASQLLRLRPDLSLVPTRGTLERRLQALGTGLDAVVVAYAELLSMGLAARATQVFTWEEMLPACGQGTIAVEARLDDPRTLELCSRINDLDAHICAMAERTLIKRLGAEPRAPVGVLAQVQGEVLTLRALVSTPDGAEALRSERSGPAALFGKTATAVADDLLRQGAAPWVRAR